MPAESSSTASLVGDQQLTRFRYRAVDQATGRRREGEMVGENAYAVRAALRRIGLETDRLQPIDRRRTPAWLAPLADRWAARHRARRRTQRGDLLDALATLLQAGLPLERALASLAASPARPKPEAAMLRDLREQVRQGRHLAQAAADQPEWFDSIDVALIDAGQSSGELDRVLQTLGAFHQRGAALGHQLTMALAYPCLLLVAGLGVVAFISTATLPQLTQVLVDAGKPIPALTNTIMAAGDILVHHVHLVIGGGLLTMFGASWLWNRIDPASRIGRRLHANPISRTRSRTRIARLARTLAHLVGNGIPLTEALDISAAVVGDRRFANFLHEASEAVRRGEDLSQQAADSHLLDHDFAELLRLGETSGELASMLDRIADRYGRAADRSIARLTALLEPAAILVLAVLIGNVVVAAALPLVAIGDLTM